jgi:dsRNA-specific ribonuclease
MFRAGSGLLFFIHCHYNENILASGIGPTLKERQRTALENY